jgi:hypothetical protein
VIRDTLGVGRIYGRGLRRDALKRIQVTKGSESFSGPFDDLRITEPILLRLIGFPPVGRLAVYPYQNSGQILSHPTHARGTNRRRRKSPGDLDAKRDHFH